MVTPTATIVFNCLMRKADNGTLTIVPQPTTPFVKQVYYQIEKFHESCFIFVFVQH